MERMTWWRWWSLAQRNGEEPSGPALIGLLVWMTTRATRPVAAKPPVQARDGRTPDGAYSYELGGSCSERSITNVMSVSI